MKKMYIHGYCKILFYCIDVASWREGGGRGAMQQQQNKPDSPSSPTGSTSQGQTETQQNGPPTSGPTEVPSQPPRPGSGPTPGGPMPMGPPMGMPPQYRMMPPYVSIAVNLFHYITGIKITFFY